MRNPYVLPILLGTVCLLGCASSRPPRLEEAETYYQEGLTALKKKRCLDAVEKLQRVVSNFSGSRVVADAQYYLAEAQFCSKDYVNAVFEYQRLIDTYPASEWIDEAQYQIAESYFQQLRRPELDQKETREALNYFRYFLEDNPDHPLAEQARQRVVECRSRLARKQYLNGELYQRQGYLDAAVMAYDEVVRSFSDTPTYYHTLLRLGEIAQARGDEAAARGHWEEALKDSEEAEVRAQAQERLAKLQAGPAK